MDSNKNVLTFGIIRTYVAHVKFQNSLLLEIDWHNKMLILLKFPELS